MLMSAIWPGLCGYFQTNESEQPEGVNIRTWKHHWAQYCRMQMHMIHYAKYSSFFFFFWTGITIFGLFQIWDDQKKKMSHEEMSWSEMKRTECFSFHKTLLKLKMRFFKKPAAFATSRCNPVRFQALLLHSSSCTLEETSGLMRKDLMLVNMLIFWKAAVTSSWPLQKWNEIIALFITAIHHAAEHSDFNFLQNYTEK